MRRAKKAEQIAEIERAVCVAIQQAAVIRVDQIPKSDGEIASTDIITTADKLACAKRELALRKNVYPHWVEQNKMSAGKAAHQIAVMEAIVRDYEDAIIEEAVT